MGRNLKIGSTRGWEVRGLGKWFLKAEKKKSTWWDHHVLDVEKKKKSMWWSYHTLTLIRGLGQWFLEAEKISQVCGGPTPYSMLRSSEIRPMVLEVEKTLGTRLSYHVLGMRNLRKKATQSWEEKKYVVVLPRTWAFVSTYVVVLLFSQSRVYLWGQDNNSGTW